MHPAVTTPAQLDERYGRGPRRRLPMILTIVAAAVVVGVFGWWTWQGSADTVDVTGTGFHLGDDHTVTVSFQISAPTNRPVHCIVEAQDEEFGIVGWRLVTYPASEQHARAFTEQDPAALGHRDRGHVPQPHRLRRLGRPLAMEELADDLGQHPQRAEDAHQRRLGPVDDQRFGLMV